MVEGKHFMAYRNSSDMLAQVKRALDPANRAEVNRIRQNGHDLVARAHTSVARAAQLDRMARCIHAARARVAVSKDGIRSWVAKCAIWKFDPDSVPRSINPTNRSYDLAAFMDCARHTTSSAWCAPGHDTIYFVRFFAPWSYAAILLVTLAGWRATRGGCCKGAERA
jgi:hypothetical protein